MQIVFESARSKIRWAEKHIGNLEQLVNDFGAAKSHRIVREYDSATNLTKLRFDSDEEIPAEIPLVFGDAIHCIRVAWDHMFFQTVKALHPSATDKSIQFAFHANRVGANGVLKNTEAPAGIAFTSALGEKIKSPFLDFMYPNGTLREGFSDLHQLDLIDKHRLIITCLFLGGAKVNEIRPFPGGHSIKNFTMVYRHNPNTAIAAIPGNQVHTDMQPHIEIITDEVNLTKNEAILISLGKFTKLVNESILKVESIFATHGEPP